MVIVIYKIWRHNPGLAIVIYFTTQGILHAVIIFATLVAKPFSCDSYRLTWNSYPLSALVIA